MGAFVTNLGFTLVSFNVGSGFFCFHAFFSLRSFYRSSCTARHQLFFYYFYRSSCTALHQLFFYYFYCSSCTVSRFYRFCSVLLFFLSNSIGSYHATVYRMLLDFTQFYWVSLSIIIFSFIVT